MKNTILAISFFIFGWSAPLSAEVMTYQGRLKESNVPVNANRTFLFEFCATETPTGCVASPDGARPFQVLNGLFKSTFTLPAVDLSAGPWYLRVKVEGSYLSPVERLTFVPYSAYASTAGYSPAALQKAGDTMTGQLTSISSVTVTGNGGVYGLQVSSNVSMAGALYSANGNVGIGTTNPQAKLDVDGGHTIFENDGSDINLYLKTKTAGAYLGNLFFLNYAGTGYGGVSGDQTNSRVNIWTGTVPGGNEKLTISSNGNVGIGTTGPAYRLVVSSGAGETGKIMTVSTGTTNIFSVDGYGVNALKFTGDGSGLTGVTGASGTDSTRVLKAGDTMTGSLLMAAGSTITVTGSDFSVGGATLAVKGGYVGMGTNAPAARLHVVSDNGYVHFTSPASGLTMNMVPANYTSAVFNNNASGPLAFSIDNSQKVIMTPQTLVGIGTAVPYYRLHVSTPAGETGVIMAVSTGATNVFSVDGYGVTALKFTGDGSGLTGLSGAAAADTATNLSGGALGTIPYQTAANTTAMLPAGLNSQVLQGNSGLAPGWTTSPSINGVNITGVPAGSLASGSLPGNVIASSIAVNSVYDSALASPKVNRAGDTMTGSLDIQSARLKVIADTAANQYSFAAGTGTVASHLYVSTSGNVGLGIANPDARLALPYNGYIGWDANNDGLNYNAHRIGKSVTGATPLEFRNDTNPGPSGKQFSFFYVGNELFTILNGGNVGIGQVNPVAMLDVAGTGSFSGSFTTLSSGTFMASGASQFSVETSSGILVQAGRIQAPALQLTNGAAVNYVLTSDAAGNASWADPVSGALGDGWVGNEITDAGNATLTRSGTGTNVDPYKLKLNTSNANTWTAAQTFSGGLSGTLTGNADTVTSGVYTTGSYADPAWITGLATSKISLSTVTARLDTASIFIATATSRLDAHLAFISTATSRLDAADSRSLAAEAFISTATSRLDAETGRSVAASVFITTATSRLDAHLAFISTATPKLDGADSRSLAAEAFISTATTAIDAKMLRSGDVMTGQLTNTSSVTITGNGGGAYGLGVSSNVSLAGVLYSANGNVGIGLENPSHELQVHGTGADINRQIHVTRDTTAAGRSGITLSRTSGGGASTLAQGNIYYDHDNNQLRFDTDSNLRNIRVDGSNVLLMPSGKVGISTGAPQARLDVLAGGSAQTDMAQIWRNSAGAIVSSVSATGVVTGSKFVGDGSALTGVSGTDATKLPLAGGTMSGQLTLAGSTLTVTGSSGGYGLKVSSNVSLAGSIYTANNRLGVGTDSPAYPLTVAGTFAAEVPTGGVSVVVKTLDTAFGTDMRLVSGTQAWAMSIGSLAEYHAYALGYYNGGGWATALTMTKTGNLGLGTGTGISSYRLQVSSAAGETGILMAVSTGTTNVFWAAGDGAHATAFWGNGSGLTNVSDTSKLPLAGGTMTGQLTNTSSVTIAGNGGGAYGLGVSSNVSLAGALYSANGNICIGGAAPGAKLDIYSPNTTSFLEVHNASNLGKKAFRVFQWNNHGLLDLFDTAEAVAIRLNADNTSASYINSGNLGVGTTAPDQKLTVAGSISQTGNLISSGTGGNYFAGNVGIGSAPSYNLHVSSGPGMAGTIMTVSTGGVNVFSVDGYGVNAINFTGSGAGLTGVTAVDATKLPLSGGALSGQLTLANSSLTVTGNAFSVAGSTTFVISNGKIGLGAPAPAFQLHVAGTGNTIAGLSSSASSTDAAVYGNTSAGASAIKGVASSGYAGLFEGNVYVGNSTYMTGAKLIVRGTTNDATASAIKIANLAGTGILTVKNDGSIGISTGSPQAALDIVSTGTLINQYAQIWRASDGTIVSSMTATGVLYPQSVPAGDNLGNHTGTQVLQMGAYGVNTSSNITAARYQIGGSTVVAILPGSASFGLGVNAGRVNTGTLNSFVGSAAGYNNTTGTNNTFLGTYAGLTNTTGGWNSFLGSSAGYSNTTGTGNSFLGYSAGYKNTTGADNSFAGSGAGDGNTTGAENSYVGSRAGYSNETGSANAILGKDAGYGVAFNSFSSSTLMGYRAGYSLLNGSADNVLVGFQAGYNVTTGTGNIVIGYGKDTTAPGANSQLNIGGVLYGDLSARTIGIFKKIPEAALDIVSTGTAANVYAQIWRDSTGLVVASMTATGRLSGDGSGLTGVSASDATKLPLAGGTLTGGLTINGSTLAVRGPGDLVYFNSSNNWGLVYINEGPTQRGVLGYGNGGTAFGAGEITGAMVMNGASALQLGGNSMMSLTLSGGKTGVGRNNPLYALDISPVNSSDLYLFRAGTDGIVVSTGGAIQTTGLGHGLTAGGVRGNGAVDLQTSRTAAGQVASGAYSAISGGQNNTAGGNFSIVAGGDNNSTSGTDSIVAGGNFNSATNQLSAVVGGNYNKASGMASFIGGGGNNAAGGWGAAAFGASNASMGDYTFAAGRAATAAVNGTFTWADSTSEGAVNSVLNQVMFKTKGGFWVSTGTVYSDPGLFVDANNRLGLGTISPSVKFHNTGSAILANSKVIDPDNYGSSVIAGWINDVGYSASAAIGGMATNAGTTWAIGHDNAKLLFGAGDATNPNTLQTFMQVSANRNVTLVPVSGNVGIGAAVPGAKLDVAGDIRISAVGSGLRVMEGSNARMGTAALVAGTVIVPNTSVTANSRIFLTAQAPGGAVGAVYVSARTPDISFTITSTNVADTSTVAWLLVEP